MEPVSRSALEEWVREERARSDVPGIAVAVLSDGGAEGFATGVLELGRDERVSVETPFRIASITKPFVATLALTLVARGDLELDAPLPRSREPATLRELLCHQGGLECEWPAPLASFGDGDDALLRVANGEPQRLPETAYGLWSYCNVGYWFVGAGIARATGTTFEHAMRTRVLEPLNLRRTGFDRPGGGASGHQAPPGSREHTPLPDAYPRVRRPSGGLWSTVGDVLAFARHHLRGEGPLPEAFVRQMQEPQVGAPGGAYGLGWFLREAGGHRVVEHAGSAAGYQSLLLLLPDERFALVALTNSSRGSAAIDGILDRLGLGRTSHAAAAPAPGTFASLAGRYRGQLLELEIEPDEEGLVLAVAERDPFSGEVVRYRPVRAQAVSEREFVVVEGEWRGDRLDFPRDGLARFGTVAARVAE